MCIKGLKTLNTSVNLIGKKADLINMKTKGFLTYPNSNLYIIIKHIEECFAIHANSNDVFEKTFEEVLKKKYKFKISMYHSSTSDGYANKYFFLLHNSKHEAIYMQNQANKKLNKTKKKLSKLVKT